MTQYHRILIVLPTLWLMPHVVVAWAATAVDPIRPDLGGREVLSHPLDLQPWPRLRPSPDLDTRSESRDDPVLTTYLVPADPDESWPRRRVPADADRPTVREREAVLPDPLNGWVLVDRVVAHAGPGRPFPAPTAHVPRVYRIHQHRWLGPGAMLPVASGG